MANIMSMKDVRNHVHRNGFDLSFRNSYSAKVGELLPVMCKEVLPGDKFTIDLASFVRTQPVKTAAFTRLKEYYDFYFVPTSLLWDKFDNYIVQTNNYNHARGFQLTPDNFTSHPYFTGQDLYNLLSSLFVGRGDKNGQTSRIYDVLGYSAFDKVCKLLQYLGYGDWSRFFTGEYNYAASSGATPTPRPFPTAANLSYNIFPLLGYQKLCQDYFRSQQWQSTRPYLFNLDYIFSNDSLKVPISNYGGSIYTNFSTNNTIFSLQYAQYKKDLFTGLLPRAQFGDTAIAAPLVGNGSFDYHFNKDTGLSPASGNALFANRDGKLYDGQGKIVDRLDISANGTYANNIGVSVFALRFAEVSQKWKEITQSGDLDFKSQLEKHWNVSVSNDNSYLSTWLGGTSSNININEVTNNNLASENSQAVLAGKGLGTNQKNNVVRFDSHQYGYLYCIYHAEPVLDWTSEGCDRQNLKISATDYAIPEFDNIGMESVPAALFANTPTPSYGGFARATDYSIPNPSTPLGYAPRYYDYKTSLDVVRGNFLTINKDWISPLEIGKFLGLNVESAKGDAGRPLPVPALTYRSFLINPSSVNSIFLAQADGMVSSDILLNSVFFDIKVVRNLSVNGLPY